MTLEYYPTRESLLQAIDSKTSGIDVNKSLFLHLFSFVTKDGEQLIINDPVTFCNEINKRFGEILDPKTTRVAGSKTSFLVGYLEGDVPESTTTPKLPVEEKEIQTVTCVDVGANQLHQKIKNDKRIKFYENQDIRTFKTNDQFDIVTCDVSFISILNILNDINRLANDKIIATAAQPPIFRTGILKT